MFLKIISSIAFLIFQVKMYSQSNSFYAKVNYSYIENYVVHPGFGGLAPFDNIFLPGISIGYECKFNDFKLPMLIDFELGYIQLGGKYTGGKYVGDPIIFHSIQPSLGLKYRFSKLFTLGAGINYSYLINSNQIGEVFNRSIFSIKIYPEFNLSNKIALGIYIQTFISPYIKFPFSPLIVDKEYWRLYGVGIKYNFR